MKAIDMRFDNNMLHSFIGLEFIKYKCDEFVYTNSVTGIVGLYIGDKVFSISNIQESVDYFGNDDDIAVMKIKEVNDGNIKTVFNETTQIDTPINGKIEDITLINENQQIYKDGVLQYNVWLTRAIVFKVDGREILFEKDIVPFSEEILIQRGYDLAKKVNDEKSFLDGWPNNLTPMCNRESVVIK